MKIKLRILTLLLMLFPTLYFGQNSSTNEMEKSDVKYKQSIGTSLFLLGNFLEDSPDYFLLTYGYRLNKRDRIFVEFNTWKYAEPLGTYGKSEEFYPGFVRAWGLGLGYQRFVWKGLFTTTQGTIFMKQYFDDNDNKIQKGAQLYLQGALGYRVEFIKKRIYLEPAIALKYWPIDTNFPDDFAKIEEGAPKYIFEPSMNIGFKF